MCGIFGIVSKKNKSIKDFLYKKEFNFFLKHSEKRGRDSSGYVTLNSKKIKVIKRDLQLTSVLDYKDIKNSPLCFGHSRLITNGSNDNQPLVMSDNILIHNGIVVNVDEVFGPYIDIDSYNDLKLAEVIKSNKKIFKSISI